jgi:hypothetical protein
MSLFLLAIVSTAGAEIIYVDADATGANDGSSWADAYNYLQDALCAAVSGDEIRVDQGIYKPDEDSAHPNGTGSRTATFRLKNGVALRGSYAGFGEPAPDTRDIDLYETILSGDLNYDDGPDFANNYENSYHVVTGSGTNDTAVLDGFTITGGNANGSKPYDRGGGMFNNNNSSPTVTNCTFSGNSAVYYGGGMANYQSSSLMVTNCIFSDNSAEYGGGMANYQSSSLMVINCIFSDNSAEYGGGIRNWNSSPTVTNCTFSGNSASSSGGGMLNSSSSPTVTNCTFNANFAGYGGGMRNGWNSNSTVTNCTFSGNSAGIGGGIFNRWASSSTLTNCILWGNVAPSGPQIYNDVGGSATVSYSDVQGGWPGIGNINADPLFVDSAIGDYHLLPDSPCKNTGDPSCVVAPGHTDLDGKPRVIGGRIDMGAYEFNHIPVADAGPNQIVEAQGPWGTRVTLDGSGSSDSDSAPGTNDDIVSFDWYKVDACDPNFEDFLASGEIIDCNLPLGEHIIVLEVIDKACAFNTNEVTIIVQDTTPPDFTLSVTPTTLWPVNHKMVQITPSWTVSDICDASPEVSLVSISMNEADKAKGDGHTTDDIQVSNDGSIYLRAERSGTGNSRIYTITYQAVDDSGNAAVASATVTVPHDQR